MIYNKSNFQIKLKSLGVNHIRHDAYLEGLWSRPNVEVEMPLMLKQQESWPSPRFSYDTASAAEILNYAVSISRGILTSWDYNIGRLFLQTGSSFIPLWQSLGELQLEADTSIWLMLKTPEACSEQ